MQAQHGYSLDAQRKKITEYVAYMKWELVDYYEDAGVSAKSGDRENFQVALGRLFAGDADMLVVIDLSRFMRNVKECLTIIDDGAKAGWTVLFLDQGGSTIDIQSSMGRSMITMMAMFAEMHSTQTAEKTRIGIADRWARGKEMGGGEISNQKSGKLILKWHKAGLSNADIARKLNRQGVPTARHASEWTAPTVRTFLVKQLGSEYPLPIPSP